MKVIAGLGNPGRKYAETRHNIGFDVAAAIIRRFSDASVRNRFESEIAEVNAGGEKLLVVCPQTFMNLSGRAIRAVLQFYKLLPEDLIVISDDLNLPAGKLRLRASGSAGGQKGLADTINQLGTDQFARLRIGINRPPPGYDVPDYVLGKFTDEERLALTPVIDDACEAALLWAKCGIADAMNRYNATPEKKKKGSRPSKQAAKPPHESPG